jgi:hypothetical protein
MFMEKIENTLDELEKEQNYSPAFYTVIQEWLIANSLQQERNYTTLLRDLDSTLAELYLYKKSLTIPNQKEVETDVLSIVEKHLEIEVSEPQVTLKF